MQANSGKEKGKEMEKFLAKFDHASTRSRLVKPSQTKSSHSPAGKGTR
jgi:hypothetical protein